MKIVAYSNTVNQIKLDKPIIVNNSIKEYGNEVDADGALVYTNNLRITFTTSEASQLPASLKSDYISKMAKLRAETKDVKPIQYTADVDYDLNPDSVRVVEVEGEKVVKAVYRPKRNRKPAFTCSLEL